MNPKTVKRVNSFHSNLLKKAAFTLALTAVTLPVAFAQDATTQHLHGPELRQAIERASKMPPAQIGKTSGAIVPFRIDLGNVTNEKWVSIGPFGSLVAGDALTNRSNGALGLVGSVVAGRAFGAAYDPRNSLIYYVATAGGGLWRNNAATAPALTSPWTPLGDGFSSLTTYCVAVNPFNSKMVVTGTGDGIQRSINGGNTFVQVGTEIVFPVKRLLFDTNGPVVTAGGANSVDTASRVYVTNPKYIDNPNRIYATSVDGIWVSDDLGNTWNNDATPATPESDPRPGSNPPQTRPIGEEWNDIEISLPNADPKAPAVDANDVTNEKGFRYMYATSRRGGLYRSLDRGASWQRLNNTPLIYNPTRESQPFFDPYAGNYGIDVAVSATDRKTLFIMDSNGNFSDGKIFVSKDAGNSWTEISGNYPVAEGTSNNWSRAGYSFGMLAIPTLLPDEKFNSIAVDAVLGATFRSYSTEFTSATRDDDPKDPVPPIDLTPLYPGRDWVNVGTTHVDQHGFAYTPQLAEQVLAVNDGGVYRLTYDSASRRWFFSGNSLNSRLAATEFYGAAFHPNQGLAVLGGTINNGATRSQGATNWSVVPVVNSAFTTTQLNDELNALAVPPAFISNRPPLAQLEVLETFTPSTYIGSTAYDRNNGQVQYMMEHTTGRIYVTQNSWARGWEITPNRTFRLPSGVELRLNGTTPITLFQQVNGQDTGPATNWDGETRKPEGILATDRFAANQMYTGGYYLWRYDLQRGDPPRANPANIDRGTWRRVGSTQLATPETVNGNQEEDYITAIAIAEGGNRLYVGTRLGRLWMNRFGLQTDGATPIPNLNGAWISLNNATLPSRLDPTPQTQIRRPITAISINPRQQQSTSDILVGVAGAGIFRCANTRGASFLFTDQSGKGIDGSRPITALPVDDITCIARDTVTRGPGGSTGDEDNSWFVGTPIGVYSTNNQGTTWANATKPLGLPQVPVVALDVNATTGFMSIATQGRGAWRFNLGAATETIAPPQLAIKFALSRNGATIYGNITVENSGGQAQNVQIVGLSTTNQPTTTPAGATLQVGTRAAVNAASIAPSSLGAIGNGPSSSRSTTITWPGSAGRTGEVVTLKISGTYMGGTFTQSVRTRLP
jgi:hypothetical protein